MLKFARLKEIKLLALDFDGVLTDNRVIVTEDGKESVICNRSDGIGLTNLREIGVETIVISTEVNPIVAKRCKKLKVPYLQGCSNKWEQLQKVISKKHIPPENVGYIGNDINDLECMKRVGIPICVADAYPEVKRVAKLITKRKGGNGVVREICDLILQNSLMKNTNVNQGRL